MAGYISTQLQWAVSVNSNCNGGFAITGLYAMIMYLVVYHKNLLFVTTGR